MADPLTESMFGKTDYAYPFRRREDNQDERDPEKKGGRGGDIFTT